MKKLPISYRKNGYQFDLIERDGDVCIYSQSDEGKVLAYEVFEVRKQPQRVINGATIEASESTPLNEQWGAKGFTYWHFSDAKNRATELRSKAEARNLSQRVDNNGQIAA